MSMKKKLDINGVSNENSVYDSGKLLYIKAKIMGESFK